MTFLKNDVCDNEKARITPSRRAIVTGRSRLANIICMIYSKVWNDSPAEEKDEGSADERTVDANNEHPRTRDTKCITEDLITAPATSFSKISEQVELKMITKTTIGARDMKTVMKASTIMENMSILAGAA